MSEISNERIALEKQIEEVKCKRISSADTLEPIKNVFLEASRATEEFLKGNEKKKHEILKNSLWNISVQSKKIVNYQFKEQFEVIAKSPKTGDFAMLLRD